MEITLTEKDMDALASAIAKKIEEKVIGKLLMSPSYDALSETAKRLATLQIDSLNFKIEAVEAMRQALVVDGRDLLKDIVMNAVSQVRKDDPYLHKEIAKAMYEAALSQAQKMLPSEG